MQGREREGQEGVRGQCGVANLPTSALEPTLGPGSPQLLQEPDSWRLHPDRKGCWEKVTEWGAEAQRGDKLANITGRSKAELGLLTARPGLAVSSRVREVQPEGSLGLQGLGLSPPGFPGWERHLGQDHSNYSAAGHTLRTRGPQGDLRGLGTVGVGRVPSSDMESPERLGSCTEVHLVSKPASSQMVRVGWVWRIIH